MAISDRLDSNILPRDLLARHESAAHQSMTVAHHLEDGLHGLFGDGLDANSPGNIDLTDFDSLMHMLYDVQGFSNASFPIGREKKNSLYRYSSRLPRLDDLESIHTGGDTISEGHHYSSSASSSHDSVWTIDETTYDRMCAEVEELSQGLPHSCSLPSRDALARYMDKYFYCIHRYLPFIHPATFYPSGKTTDLLLAVAMTGASYAFEPSKAHDLYFLSKLMIMRRIQSGPVSSTANSFGVQETSDVEKGASLIQTLLLLTLFASWAGETLSADALSMRHQLASMIRQEGLVETAALVQSVDWLSWVAAEQRRRTLLAAYVLFNMHSIAFGVPPMIMNYEISLSLPSAMTQWEAQDSVQWQEIASPSPVSFHQALQSLRGDDECGALASSYTAYILIHGLLQQTYIDRHSSLGLKSDVIKQLEHSLSNWQSAWERSPEFNLDPYTSQGPMGANATALFRLAYIQLIPDWKVQARLEVISTTGQIVKSPQLVRSSQVHKAILHSIHALGLIVQHGVAMVSSMSMPFWTIEHSMCGVECAILLQSWLEGLASTAESNDLSKVDTELLQIISTIMKDADAGKMPDMSAGYSSYCREISKMTASLWYRAYQGRHVLGINKSINALFKQLASSN